MKSHVSMATNTCVICMTEHETGEVLLHKRMSPVLDPKTNTGLGVCPSCAEKLDDGYIALIETQEAAGDRTSTTADIPRTGAYAFIREEAFQAVFTTPVPPRRVAFVEPRVMDLIREASGSAQEPRSNQELH